LGYVREEDNMSKIHFNELPLGEGFTFNKKHYIKAIADNGDECGFCIEDLCMETYFEDGYVIPADYDSDDFLAIAESKEE
jgi:hypothetical protein